jgi:4-amino-4-deoxy-L-arabinose transferase-like glycosyltransferase
MSVDGECFVYENRCISPIECLPYKKPGIKSCLDITCDDVVPGEDNLGCILPNETVIISESGRRQCLEYSGKCYLSSNCPAGTQQPSSGDSVYCEELSLSEGKGSLPWWIVVIIVVSVVIVSVVLVIIIVWRMKKRIRRNDEEVSLHLFFFFFYVLVDAGRENIKYR